MDYIFLITPLVGMAGAVLAGWSAIHRFHLTSAGARLKMMFAALLLTYGMASGLPLLFIIMPFMAAVDGLGGLLILTLLFVWITFILPIAYWIRATFAIGPIVQTYWIPGMMIVFLIAGAIFAVIINNGDVIPLVVITAIVMFLPSVGTWHFYRACLDRYGRRLSRFNPISPSQWHQSPTGPKMHGHDGDGAEQNDV